MCFVSRPMKIDTFLQENGDLPKRVVDFPRKETHSETKSLKSSRIWTKKSNNNNSGKPWKSSRIFRVKPKLFIFSLFFIFFIFSFLSFFHFSSFFLFFFISIHFSSFLFIFLVFFLFFSFLFLHLSSFFFSFSFSFWVARNPICFSPQLLQDFL